jgi:hypothetical protein
MLFFKNKERLSNRNVFSFGVIVTLIVAVLYFLYECVTHNTSTIGAGGLFDLNTWSYPLRREVVLTIIIILAVGVLLSAVTSFTRALREPIREFH